MANGKQARSAGVVVSGLSFIMRVTDIFGLHVKRQGKRVASDVCTIVDDGTLPGRRGSLNMDDEGTPTGRTVLIERGILRGYITDKLNARLMGIPVTGNGRRESYQSVVLPRMTNTFMLAGASDPDAVS